MEAKEKAKELVDSFFDIIDKSNPLDDIEKISKQCALVATNHMINTLPFTDLNTALGKYCEKERSFLKEVQKEIKNYKGN